MTEEAAWQKAALDEGYRTARSIEVLELYSVIGVDESRILSKLEKRSMSDVSISELEELNQTAFDIARKIKDADREFPPTETKGESLGDKAQG